MAPCLFREPQEEEDDFLQKEMFDSKRNTAQFKNSYQFLKSWTVLLMPPRCKNWRCAVENELEKGDKG